MEITLSIILSSISVIFCIATFVVNRKDKAVKDAKETNMELFNYRLDIVDKNVQKILDKMDNSVDETKKIVQDLMEKHILEYHKS